MSADNNGRFSFGIRHLLLFLAACSLILGAWRWLIRWPSVSISGAEIKQATAIKFGTDHLPDYLEIRIVGKLDGRATVTDPWETTTKIGPGDFDLSMSNEYYDQQATIMYSPSTARSGTLTVYYNFDGY